MAQAQAVVDRAAAAQAAPTSSQASSDPTIPQPLVAQPAARPAAEAADEDDGDGVDAAVEGAMAAAAPAPRPMRVVTGPNLPAPRAAAPRDLAAADAATQNNSTDHAAAQNNSADAALQNNSGTDAATQNNDRAVAAAPRATQPSPWSRNAASDPRMFTPPPGYVYNAPTATVIPRADLDRELSDFNALGAQVAAVVGPRGGFRIVSLRPGCFFERIGLRPGDVVMRVDGRPINAMEDASRAYAWLRVTDHFTVDVWRAGRALTLRYIIS